MTTTISGYRIEQQITSVRLYRSTNITATYYNGQSNDGNGATLTTAASTLTVDSVAVVNGDRILVAGQTTAYQNGIYQVSGVGTLVVLTRTDDFQVAQQMVPGYYVPVSAGTVYGGGCFTIVEPQVQVVGVDAPIFTDNSSAPTSVTFTNTGLRILNPAGTFYTTVTPSTAILANRSFTLALPDADTTLTLAGSTSVSAFGATLVDDATKLVALTTLGVKRATTAAYGGGGTSNAFTATGLVSTDIVVATILASTNAVSICKAVPTADTLTITFSADPGAGTTVQWHAIATV